MISTIFGLIALLIGCASVVLVALATFSMSVEWIKERLFDDPE